MLVGSAELDYQVIRGFANDLHGLREYTDNLVPLWARHIPQIIMNQRYFVAISVRNMLQIPFKQRREMYTSLITDCTIHGIVNVFTPIESIFDECNVTTLVELLRRDYNEA